ncbi:MAG: methyltransferase [Gammaproteobacteria bacterium]|nr:methyltransferase [Gammaproteobacteria bacterium]MBU1481582.1 methyltransferase [Gammaproteobacteria bacterium]
MTANFHRTLLQRATQPYRSAGLFAWKFAKGKLKGDPAFVGLLEHGLIPDAERLIDLGCGQGLLAAWLLEARALHESGHWPAHWPAAPKVKNVWGLELMPKDVARARAALGDRARFELGNICTADFGKADVVIILDVLHYIDYAAQEDVLRRIRAALPTGGTFITRIGDAAGGLPFKFSNWVDRTVFFIRGHRVNRIYCRTQNEWLEVLKRTGFVAEAMPMHKGTPFCNVMLVAKAI